MSQYIHFFVRSTDKLLPIRTASRSSPIYHFYGDYAPYEKVRALSMIELQDIYEEINTQISEWTQRVEQEHANLELIASFQNSVEDKMEAIKSSRDIIHEDEEIIEDMKGALSFTSFLMNMYNEAEGTKYYDREDIKIDPTRYLYFGIECGVPSIAEVKEWENSKE